MSIVSESSTIASLRETSWRGAAVAAGLVLFLGVWFFQQPLFPSPWFDEGLNLSTAATLARDGVYALPDSSGARVFDPAIQTGPTIILPVALVFRWVGAGLMQARVVILLFTIFTIFVYAIWARRLFGSTAMLLALFLLLVGSREPFASFFFMSRQVLGEVPSLGFYLAGLVLWWHAVQADRPALPWLGLAGLAWGAAMVTKSQMFTLLPTSLLLLLLLNLLFYKQVGFRFFLIPGLVALGCVLLWYLVQVLGTGLEQFQRNASVLREGFALHIMGLNPAHWRNALSVHWHSLWWLWGMPGLIWGLTKAMRPTRDGFLYAAALVLPLLVFFWFTFFSIGWGRYAFYLYVLSPMWEAGLLVGLWNTGAATRGGSIWRWAAGLALLVYLLLNGAPLFAALVSPADSGYHAMRDYLNESVPTTGVIESWEWELSFDTPQQFHHPSTSVLNAYTAMIYSGKPLPNDVYDPLQSTACYLLIGPFGSWTGIYNTTVTGSAKKLAAFGDYSFYKMTNGNPRCHDIVGQQ